jgi:hypothetical protein
MHDHVHEIKLPHPQYFLDGKFWLPHGPHQKPANHYLIIFFHFNYQTL